MRADRLKDTVFTPLKKKAVPMLPVLLSSILIIAKCSKKMWGFWNSGLQGRKEAHVLKELGFCTHTLILAAWQRASNGRGCARDGGHCSKHLQEQVYKATILEKTPTDSLAGA